MAEIPIARTLFSCLKCDYWIRGQGTEEEINQMIEKHIKSHQIESPHEA